MRSTQRNTVKGYYQCLGEDQLEINRTTHYRLPLQLAECDRVLTSKYGFGQHLLPPSYIPKLENPSGYGFVHRYLYWADSEEFSVQSEQSQTTRPPSRLLSGCVTCHTSLSSLDFMLQTREAVNRSEWATQNPLDPRVTRQDVEQL